MRYRSVSYIHNNEYTKLYLIFCKILKILPQTKASSPGHVAFLIMLVVNMVSMLTIHCLPSSNIEKTIWLWEEVASKNINKNTTLISLAFKFGDRNVSVDKSDA